MDVELVERARHGDREAFTELATASVDRLHAIAFLVLRDAHLAEDAAQEALVQCWRWLPSLRDPQRFDAWLYRILMHAIGGELGRRRRFAASVRSIVAEPATGDATQLSITREELERGFARLPFAQRSVVVLHHYVGMSLPEVATALAIPLGTAKSRHRLALATLRSALEADARTPVRGEATV